MKLTGPRRHASVRRDECSRLTDVVERSIQGVNIEICYFRKELGIKLLPIRNILFPHITTRLSDKARSRTARDDPEIGKTRLNKKFCSDPRRKVRRRPFA
jgi:hypothetical protein